MYVSYYQYWGKAQPEAEQASGYHLLPYHCLDVAAVGHVLLSRHPRLCALLAGRLGLDEATFSAWQVFFLALHDVGKFSKRFQALRPDICQKLQSAVTPERYHPRHTDTGWLLWKGKLADEVLDRPAFGNTPCRIKRRVLGAWAQTVMGHHGQPPKPFWGDKTDFVLSEQFTPQDREAAGRFSADCAALLLPDTAMPDLKTLESRLTPLSWWLAGIAVVCDWLGSNQELFGYHADVIPLDEYWRDHALPGAARALEHSGVLPLIAQQHSLTDLFAYLNPPTPLQQQAADLPLSDGLWLLEDVTGSGKTEAALMLAHRLIGAGQADGVYFGLPTMATSNAMFARIEPLAKRFFTTQPAVLLAHSASKMQQDIPRQVIFPDSPPEADYAREEAAAAGQRGAWLFDNRKKALLADFGVGTIDQALLAVLYSRHQSLRLLGLSRKVLIVDEVHACDVYMQRLLEGLLTFHAAIGGSAILLSATLPQDTRQALVNAYCKGLQRQAPELSENAYPLLTRVSAAGKEEIPLATRPAVARRVNVRLLPEVSEVHAVLVALHQAGRCGCWIRNTVNDALQAVADLQAAGIPAECLDLFHARFALGDRLAIEQRVLGRFDPDSGQAERAGRIVVATQVVEQSLDLDFDGLVSDLAPMDLLIQRAGRLCRHHRDAAGNRADTEQRGTPVLYVHGPAPVAEPQVDWYEDFFPHAAYVYEHHGRLWLTADLLAQYGAIVMPEQARDLIEGVYGPESLDRIPAALQEKTWTVDGKQMTQRAMAGQNLLTLQEGYAAPTFNFWDDTLTPTRLGDPTLTVRLAKWENGELQPWYAAERFAWELSQINVRQSLMSAAAEPTDPALRQKITEYNDTIFDKGRWSELLVLVREGEDWVGEAVDRHGEKVRILYDATVGLRKV